MKRSILLCVVLLLCAPAFAQGADELILLYESDMGVRPAQIFTDGFESGDVSRFDMNGDDIIDLILQRDDGEGNLQDLRVRDGRTREVLWEVQDVTTTLGFNIGMPPTLWGFADPDADGEREAIFTFRNEGAERAVALVNPGDNTLSWDSFDDSQSALLGVRDLTDDGSEDLLILRLDSQQLQIWGDPHVD